MLITQEQLEVFASFGYRLYQDGKFEDAAVIFRGLTVVAKESHYGWAGLGAIALTKNPPDLDGAIQNLQIAVELNPNDPTMHANLGEALLRKCLFGESREEFERAMALDPEKKNPSVNRARAIIEGLKIATEELQKMSESSVSQTS